MRCPQPWGATQTARHLEGLLPPPFLSLWARLHGGPQGRAAWQHVPVTEQNSSSSSRPEQAPQVPGLIRVYGVTGHMEPSLEPLPSSGLPAPWAFQDPGWEGWIPNPHPTVDLGFVESSRCLNTSLYTLQFEILGATFPRPPG